MKNNPPPNDPANNDWSGEPEPQDGWTQPMHPSQRPAGNPPQPPQQPQWVIDPQTGQWVQQWQQNDQWSMQEQWFQQGQAPQQGYPQQQPNATQPGYPPQPGYGQGQYPQYQQVPPPPPPPPARQPKQRKPMGCCSCFFTALLVGGLALLVILGVYFLAPFRTNVLVLGIDRAEDGSALGRSDTIVLTSVIPLKPDVSMLSIPRDLWVNIPGVGENRINTAHFFAEAQESGSGPQATLQTIEENFGVDIPYYVRVRFDSFMSVVDALGGVTVNLPQDMAGLPAGEHHLDSQQALAFVRDRKGADDFFRMEHGQFLMRSILTQLIQPASWSQLPGVAQAVSNSVDTNLPFWELPRLGLAVVRAGADGIDSRTVQREMTQPYVTDGGAQVLLPNWDLIRPMVDEMFGK